MMLTSPSQLSGLKFLPKIVIEPSLAHDMDELVAGCAPGRKWAVVADENTALALGDNVLRALKGAFDILPIRLSKPCADMAHVETIIAQAAHADALIAVGSGTINDLCKYASYKLGRPYVVFPTAASMNGYLSANASLGQNNYKKTFPAAMPLAVFCDLSVIAAAPVRLSQSGLGDSLARSTAQADWLLSHLLLGTAYDEKPFELLAPLEPELFDHARGIALSDHDSVALLLKTLLLSGLGMTLADGSYPASQGEHMIAHAMEMRMAHGAWLHGEAVGVTTLHMSRLQGNYLRQGFAMREEGFDPIGMEAFYGPEIARQAKEAFAQKAVMIAGAQPFDWQAVAEKISRVALPPSLIEKVLKEAEAPVHHAQLGWSDDAYRFATATARFLRERFTFLDLE